MGVEKIFGRDKQIDFTNAKKLANMEDGEKFEVKDFQVINSRKHNSEFVVIQTPEDEVFTTWSQIITQKFGEVTMDDIAGVTFTLRHRTSASGRQYMDIVVSD